MNQIKRIIIFLDNFLHLYLPMILFLLMFFLFILQIFSRYILNLSLTWSTELISVWYIWIILLGTNYTYAKNEHIDFPILYERFSIREKVIFSMIGDIIIIFSFIVLIFPTIKQIKFFSFQKTPILYIPYSILHLPFLIFIFYTLILTFIDFYKNLNIFHSIYIKKNKKIGDNKS